MPLLTPDAAFALLKNRPDVEVWLKDDGTDHLKYAYRVQFTKEPRREMAVARRSTEDGVTVYLNKRSCSGDALSIKGLNWRFPGVKGKEEYEKGYVGKTGDIGIAAGAGSCPSLLPLHNDVLRVACSDLEGFRQLVNWYSDRDVPAKAAPAPSTPSAVSPGQSAPPPVASAPAADAGAHGASSVEAAASEQRKAGVEEDDEVGTGRLADPVQRKAVERRAVDLAKAHYEELGFVVREEGKPYDLLCTPGPLAASGRPVVHVEVKGSISAATSVHLTKNEIADARQPGKDWRSDLFVVSRIELVQDEAGAWVGIGGVPEVHEDWSPEDDDLTATDFVYRVPRSTTR